MNFYSFGSIFSPISIASSNTNDDLFIDDGPRFKCDTDWDEQTGLEYVEPHFVDKTRGFYHIKRKY